MEPPCATCRNASSPSSHYPLGEAGMLLKTIFSQGKSEMKMPLGKSHGPPANN